VVPTLPDGPDSVEYATRLARVRDAMAARSLSALVVTDPANLYYLTGYNAWSFYTPQCLVGPAEGDVRLFARAMDAAGATDTCVLPRDQIEGYPEALVHQPDVHPFDWIAERAVETGVLTNAPDACVAVEGDAHFFPVRGYLALAKGLPAAELVDSRELVNWVRVVKSPYEQQLMRVAGTITTRAMTAALEALTPGRRQCDVVADIMSAQAKGTEEHGGDYPAIVPMLPTGEKAGTPHLTWTDQPFVEGEATTIELAGVFRRYHVPLARTVALGTPEDRLVHLADAVTDGMAAALDALRPGASPHDAHSAFTAVISREGFTKESRIGYSIGIGYPPDWGERTISLRTDDTTPLEAGMAFHVILGMWMDGWGYELSEPVLITDDGAERLTDLPQQLTITR
jgi:ectoine hydrolase